MPYQGKRPTGDRPTGGRPSGNRPQGGAPSRDGYKPKPQGFYANYKNNFKPHGENPDDPRGQREGFSSREDNRERRNNYPPRDGYHSKGQSFAPRGDRPERPARPYNSDRPERPDRPQGFKPRGDNPHPPRPMFDRERNGVRIIDRSKPSFEPREIREPREPRPIRAYESREQTEADTPNTENILAGRNPIREAIRAGRDLEKLMVAKGDLSGSAREIVALARENGVPVHEVDRAALERLSPAHQGLVAIASAYRYSTMEDMLERASARGEAPLIVILDGITDPHNLGAIIRSAECAGAHGVIVPERRAVGLTAAAVKASAGAIEHLPVARVGNLPRLLAELKEKGLWILAAHTSGEEYDKADLTGPVALVIGSEGEGVSRLVLEKSDRKITLPIRGRTESLNASVAAGVLLYEVIRRRGV